MEAGLTGQDLGRLAGWHHSKVSKIEHGRRPPSIEDIRAWCAHCGVVDQVPDLIATRQAVTSAYVEWRRVEASGLSRLQGSILPLYEQTRQFRVYHPLLIPGLLQTPGYAAALLHAVRRFRRLPDDVDSAVAARISRQRVLYKAGRRLAVIIEETALRNRLGDNETMSAQLGHLIAMAGLPSVSLGIIPFETERPMWAVEGFSIFDESRVHVELLSAWVTITQPRELAIYARAFVELGEMAVHGAKARILLVRAIQALEVEHAD
jgi:transcriptional regulator with XRE-family HTH domain